MPSRAVALVLVLVITACTHRNKPTPATSDPTSAGFVQAGSGAGTGAVVGSPAASGRDGGAAVAHITRKQWPTCTPSAPDDSDAGPSPYDDTCVIDEKHGVFADVAHGNDSSGDGTRDAPFKSLAAAIRRAVTDHKHVYACAGLYPEPMLIGTDISNGLEVYGGLSCETFLPDPNAGRSIAQAKGKGAALEIADTKFVTVERFDFENIPGDGVPGTDYIGGFIQDARRIVLRDVSLRAAPGENGADGAAPSGPGKEGLPGNPGADACAANPNPGAGPVSTLGCVTPSMYIGGNLGGDGAIGTGNGGTGFWQGFQGGGMGDTGSGWSCMQGSGVGPLPNMNYPGGSGSGAQGFGALVGSGFVGFSGQPGSDGPPGNGGAGGGGARAPSSCAGLAMPTGASGGGGGSGGCGGKGGKGGGPGGSSFGLVLIDSDVRMEGGAIVFGSGGKGGRGAIGQLGGKGAAGGKGGQGASGSKAACDGTAGGDGGNGGPGGGGNGGHAIGILYTGGAAELVDTAGETAAKANKGGDPGRGPDNTDPMPNPMLDMQLTGTPGVSAFTYQM